MPRFEMFPPIRVFWRSGRYAELGLGAELACGCGTGVGCGCVAGVGALVNMANWSGGAVGAGVAGCAGDALCCGAIVGWGARVGCATWGCAGAPLFAREYCWSFKSRAGRSLPSC